MAKATVLGLKRGYECPQGSLKSIGAPVAQARLSSAALAAPLFERRAAFLSHIYVGQGPRLDARKRSFGFSCAGSGLSASGSFRGVRVTCAAASGVGISVPISPRGVTNHAR